MPAAIIYARLSKDDRTERIDSQVARCEAYCSTHGIDVVAVLTEDDASASAYAAKARPRYREAIAHIEAGTADTLVAWDLDRLWRQPRELEQLITFAETGVCAVRTIAGDYDLTIADDRFRARILVSVAAKESDDKSRRIRARHEDLAAAGGWSGGKRPYGYEGDRAAPGGLRIVPAEAAVIRGFVDAVLAGRPLGQIVDEANGAGVVTAQGGPWTLPSVRGIVTSDRVAGRRVHRRSGETFPALWEAIITPAELDQVRRLLLARGGRRNLAGWKQYLLSGGLAVCGKCGAGLIAARTGSGAARYVCPAKNRGGCGGVSCAAEALEETVGLMACLAAAETVPASAAPAGAKYDAAADQEMLTDLMADYTSRRITKEEWQTAREAITARMATATRTAKGDPLAGYREPGSFATAWPDLGHAARRVILEALLEKVAVMPATRRGPVWDPDRVVPTWRL